MNRSVAVAELDGVGKQVGHYLDDAVPVGQERGDPFFELAGSADTVFFGEALDPCKRFLHDGIYIARFILHLDLARFNLRDVENVVDEADEADRVVLCRLQEVLLILVDLTHRAVQDK